MSGYWVCLDIWTLETGVPLYARLIEFAHAFRDSENNYRVSQDRGWNHKARSAIFLLRKHFNSLVSSVITNILNKYINLLQWYPGIWTVGIEANSISGHPKKSRYRSSPDIKCQDIKSLLLCSSIPGPNPTVIKFLKIFGFLIRKF